VVVVVVLGIVAAAVLPSIYRDRVDAEAKPVPTVAATRPASTLDPSDLSGPWTIGSGSTAGYRLHEVLNGQAVTVTGRTSTVHGSATVAGTSITAADITVDVASIHTDSGQRDSYFRDSVMDVDAFPDATFRLTSAAANAVPTTDQGTTTVTVHGDLTLHGVTKPVTATLSTGLSGDGADVSGSIPVTFSDFGIQAPSLGFVKVETHGTIEFLVHATPAAR
jgi:polyisoprenoid-binding protein YceI